MGRERLRVGGRADDELIGLAEEIKDARLDLEELKRDIARRQGTLAQLNADAARSIDDASRADSIRTEAIAFAMTEREQATADREEAKRILETVEARVDRAVGEAVEGAACRLEEKIASVSHLISEVQTLVIVVSELECRKDDLLAAISELEEKAQAAEKAYAGVTRKLEEARRFLE